MIYVNSLSLQKYVFMYACILAHVCIYLYNYEIIMLTINHLIFTKKVEHAKILLPLLYKLFGVP